MGRKKGWREALAWDSNKWEERRKADGPVMSVNLAFRNPSAGTLVEQDALLAVLIWEPGEAQNAEWGVNYEEGNARLPDHCEETQ